MIYDTLEEALQNDPRKKGVGLFRAYEPADIPCREAWLWARSKRDAIGILAASRGWEAHKHVPGRVVENDDITITVQEEMFDV